MPPQIEKGTIVLREWDRIEGFNEAEVAFHSLDQLFELCLRIQNAAHVDRILIRGVDDDGQMRTVAFEFMSVSQGEQP